MSTTDPNFYQHVAESLVALGEHAVLGKRYLSLLRRAKILRRGVSQAQAISAKDNVLADIKFRPPLSVAGCGSPVIVRAEAMLRDGIPVATEKDEKGKHRGTPMDDVICDLFAHTGEPYTELQILELYRAFMAGHPSCLVKHPEKRFRRIKKLLLTIAIQTKELEGQLAIAVIEEHDERRFAFAMDSSDLLDALNNFAVGESVIVGHRHGRTRLDGIEVQTLWGIRSGLAVLPHGRLRTLCSREGIVQIECCVDGWRGRLDRGERVGEPGGKRFRYFGV